MIKLGPCRSSCLLLLSADIAWCRQNHTQDEYIQNVSWKRSEISEISSLVTRARSVTHKDQWGEFSSLQLPIRPTTDIFFSHNDQRKTIKEYKTVMEAKLMQTGALFKLWCSLLYFLFFHMATLPLGECRWVRSENFSENFRLNKVNILNKNKMLQYFLSY